MTAIARQRNDGSASGSVGTRSAKSRDSSGSLSMDDFQKASMLSSFVPSNAEAVVCNDVVGNKKAGDDTDVQYWTKRQDEGAMEEGATSNDGAAAAAAATSDICTSCDERFDVACSQCKTPICTSCTSTSTPQHFSCEYCQRSFLCGTCLANVPCSGSGCPLSNCMECAENGLGDVLYCTHCGRGYCTSCKPLEYCYCLEGDACPECHAEMHDYDVECYWRHLPADLPGIIVDEFASKEDICVERQARFWRECALQFLPQDHEFDLTLYRRMRRARAASLILASHHLLKGKVKEAIYLILYAALLEEVWNRGANYLKQMFDSSEEKRPPNAKVLAIYFSSFHSVIDNTATKASIIALLHNQLPSIREKDGRKVFQCIDAALGKLEKCNKPIHSSLILTAKDYEEELSDHNYGDTLSMNILTSSMDNESTKQKIFVYKDVTLAWWLHGYIIKCMYHRWLTSPVTPSTEYFRVIHQGRAIMLRSAASTMTLDQLGIRDGDEVVVEGIESEENSNNNSPQFTASPGNSAASACISCNISTPDAEDNNDESPTFETCFSCGKTNCSTCSMSYFDCEYCERLLCGECVPNVPCEGPNCELSNCMECAEQGDGEVLYCTNCGCGFCDDCRSMEFCFCLVGDTCQECHSEMHDYDVEYYWQHLPDDMQRIVEEFAVGDITMDQLAMFWRECSLRFLLADKDFDVRVHRKTRQARAASLILASYTLVNGHSKEAIYLILYAALLEEVWNRGANYIKKVFENDYDSSTVTMLDVYFGAFRSVIDNTTTQANIMALLHNQVPSINQQEGKELFKCMDFALGKVKKSNTPIHAIPMEILSMEDRGADMRDRNSSKMNIITTNMDSGQKEEREFHKDTSLSWWLKMEVIKCSYEDWLRNPEIPPSTKYFRVVHKGKTIFLSSAGKKTLHALGIRDGDEIVIGGVEAEDSNDVHHHGNKKARSKKDSKKNKKHRGGKKNKKTPNLPAAPPSLTDEQLIEKWRQEHSRTMTPVFEELGPLLKDIRNRLNDLVIKKSAPKIRKRKSPNKKKVEPPLEGSMALPVEDVLGGKAGKVAYPILIGEVSNLYKTQKTRKPLAKCPIIIDLHGYSRDDAICELDTKLPIWVDIAMKGEYPWVIPIDIICGGGTQRLSEVVQYWIRSHQQVANRPKGFV